MPTTLPADISESKIRSEMPDILDLLLLCRSQSTAKTPKNIIWANNHYLAFGEKYAPTAPITPDLITGSNEKRIQPRALKSAEQQKARTKANAEVFTPLHIVKLQNDALEENYRKDNLTRYLNRKWLEIACGEAPYMASRYQPESGEIVPILERVGFVDRKLKRLCDEIYDIEQWHELAKTAFQASYGFEWNGDSLLLARENLLYTYWDYFVFQFGEKPSHAQLYDIADIISYNLFQMDGLTYTVPLSATPPTQITVSDLWGKKTVITLDSGHKGKPAKIRNWRRKGIAMQFFKTSITP